MNAILTNLEREIDEALTYHRGDVRATIAALIADRDFLARELQYASLAASSGSVKTRLMENA